MKNKKTLINYILIFVILIFLCALFPWSGDDWAWGSDTGMDIFHSFFKDYNGRYLGNLLVLALTRSRILRACVMAATCTGLLYHLSKLTGGMTELAVLLLLMMPAQMFAQSVAWTSGFSNYVPSVLISIVYISITSNLFENEVTKYGQRVPWICLLLGLVGGLFVEHITIYNICLGLFMCIYCFARYRKVMGAQIAFLIGAVISPAVMFSNGAYRTISQGGDWYRSVAHGLNGMIGRAYNNTVENIIPFGFRGCPALMVALCVAAWIASGVFHSSGKGRTWHEASKTIITAFTALVVVENTAAIQYIALWHVFELVGVTLYLLAWPVFIFTLNVGVPERASLMLYWGSAVTLMGCLLIVTPIGARCLFAPYVFLLLMTGALLKLSLPLQKRKSVLNVIAIGASVCVLYYFNIYGAIALFDHARIEKALQDVAQGNEIIYIPNMIYGEFVWNADPESGTVRETRFKQFYGIEDHISIENVN